MILGLTPFIKEDIIVYATSWKLTRDIAGTDVVEESILDTINIDSWEINVVVPTGEVWYAFAVRYLQDLNGNEVKNDEVIPPTPVYSNESQLSENLAPRFTISEPYINLLQYEPGIGLTISLDPYKSNVSYYKTFLSLYNENDVCLLNKTMDMNVSNSLMISVNEVDFSKENYIKVLARHVAAHSTVSSLGSASIYPSRIYYTIKGKTNNLDYTKKNTISFFGISDAPITVTSASLSLTDGIKLVDCAVSGPTITLTSDTKLSPNSTYIITFTISYYDEEGVSQSLTDTVNITTGSVNEAIPYSDIYDYDYSFNHLATIGNADIDINKSYNFNTEEMFTGVIPMVSDSNDIDSYLFNIDDNTLLKATTSEYNFNGSNSFRLINKTKAILQRINDGELVIDILRLDVYSDKFTLLKTIYTGIASNEAGVKSFTELNGNVYIAGPSLTDPSTILVNKLDINTYELNALTKHTTEDAIINVAVSIYNENSILLLPNGGNTSYYMDVTNEYTLNALKDGFNLPSNFINTNLLSSNLYNGKTAVIRLGASSDKSDMFFVDPETNSVELKENYLEIDGTIFGTAIIRNGTLLCLSQDDDNLYIYSLS